MNKTQKIQDIISTSGHDFHLKIAQELKSLGWDVTLSQYFTDPITEKSREIDIVAIKKFDVTDWAGDVKDHFTVRLLVECKHIAHQNVLWFVPKNIEASKKLAKDNIILRHSEDYDLMDNSSIPNKIHHYVIEEDVMKLGSKTGNSDPFYDAMSGCLNAAIFYKEYPRSDIRNVVDFPLMIVNSFENLVRRNDLKKDGFDNICENFQMEIDYAFPNKESKPQTKFFLIDVVSSEKLNEFICRLIENDVSIIRTSLAVSIRQRHLSSIRRDPPQARFPNNW